MRCLTRTVCPTPLIKNKANIAFAAWAMGGKQFAVCMINLALIKKVKMNRSQWRRKGKPQAVVLVACKSVLYYP